MNSSGDPLQTDSPTSTVDGFDSWKRSRPRDGRRRRRGLLAVTGLLGTATIAGLFYALFQPFFTPDVHLFSVTLGEPTGSPALDDPDAELNVVSYAANDAAAFQKLARRIHRYDADHPDPAMHAGETRADLKTWGGRLEAVTPDAKHVLLLYVSATGITDPDGEPVLEWPSGDPDAPSHRARVSELLAQIRRSKARLKLLLLDAGQREFSLRESRVANDFPQTLRKAVGQTGDGSLWVLVSHSPLETSFVSHQQRRSYFSLAVTRAFGTDADGDDDGSITIGEFYRFVAANVSRNVMQVTGHYRTQTPLLCWGKGDYRRQLGTSLLPTRRDEFANDEHDAGRGSSAFSTEIPTADVQRWLPTPAATETGGSAGSLHVPELLRQQSISAASTGLPVGADRPSTSPMSTSDVPQAANGKQAAQTPGGRESNGKTTNPASQTQPAEGVTGGLPLTKSPPKSSPENVAERLAAAWRFRDRLMDRSRRTRTLVDFAPQLLRAIERELLRLERHYRIAGPFEPDEAATDEKPDVWPRFAMQHSRELDDLLRFMAAVSQQKKPVTAGATPLEKAIEQYFAARRLPTMETWTVAMEEQLALAESRPVDPVARKAIQRFDALVASGGYREFIKWAGQLTPEELRFAELHFARALSRASHLTWPQIRVALSARRYAEQVVAAAIEEWNWVGDVVAEADQLRRSSERQLLDGIGSDFAERSKRILDRAILLYETAAKQGERVRTAKQQYRDAAFRALDYVRWHHAGDFGPPGSGPGTRRVELLLETLRQLAAVLDAPSSENLNTVHRLSAALQSVQDGLKNRLRRSVEPAVDRLLNGKAPVPGDRLRLQTALQLPLLDARLRQRVLHAAARLGREENFVVHSSPHRQVNPRVLSRADWNKLLDRARLDVALAESTTWGQPEWRAGWDDVRDAFQSLQSISNQRGGDSESRWAAHRRFAKILRRFRSRLTGEIARQIPGISEVSGDRNSDGRQGRRCNGLLRRMRLLTAAEIDRLKLEELTSKARSARMLAGLLHRRQRFRSALHDAPDADVAFLRKAVDGLGEAALRFNAAPPTTVSVGPVRTTVSKTVSLVESNSAELHVEIKNLGPRDADVKVLCEFDGRLVRVGAAGRSVAFLDRSTPAAEKTHSDGLPPRSQALAWERDWSDVPSLTIESGGRRELLLSIQRRSSRTSRPTRLIVHVRHGSEVTRETTDVILPAPKSVELLVESPANQSTTISRENGISRLHPFANGKTGFQFRLRSLRPVEQKVDVQLYVPARRLPILPVSPLSKSEFDTWRERIGAMTLIGRQMELTLPVNGEPVLLKPEPVAAGAAAASTKAGGQAQGLQPAGLAQLEQGLLLVVTDRQTGRSSLRPLRVAVQRPRQFLSPRVSFDAETRRLQIQLTARNADWLPEGPVAVRCELTPELPEGVDSRLNGEVSRENATLTLFGVVPQSPRAATRGLDRRTIRLEIHVNGFPRAFVFRVPTDRDSHDIPELVDRNSVRLHVPEDSRVLSGSAKSVPVTLQVDAPVGSFQNGEDRLDVGVDADRDRRLKGEFFRDLFSDRSVTVAVEEITPDGVIVLRTAVADWELSLPIESYKNRRVNLLSRLVVNGRPTWSNAVPVLVDDRPPQIPPIPTLSAVDGEPLPVVILASDEAGSGVAKVEVAVDSAGIGQFSKDPPPALAAPDSQGRWVIQLPADQLKPGKFQVLVRATDAAGNATKTRKVPLVVLSKQEAERRNKPQPIPVEGIVIFDGDPIPEAAITLTPLDSGSPVKIPTVSSDKNGEFVFPSVPPGKYRLTAKKGALANKNRTAGYDLTVPESTEALQRQRIEFR